MDYSERELLVSRISAGYLRHKNVKLYAQKYDYELDLYYEKAYRQAIKRGCLSDGQLDSLLYNLDIWTEVEEEKEKEITQEIDNLKVHLYQEFLSSRIITIKQALKREKEKLVELTSKKFIYSDFSARGCAEYVKTCYYIKRYSEPSTFSRRLLSYFRQQYITDSTIRELAKTEPWSSTYSARQTNGQVFNIDLTFEQTRLLRWSLMYERIGDNPDCPPDSIIQDDDALDGWLILQQRERKKKQKKELKLNETQQRANEIFIPAKEYDEYGNKLDVESQVREINDMNDGMAKAIKQSRANAIQEKGEVLEQHLPDVKKRLQMELARMRAKNG